MGPLTLLDFVHYYRQNGWAVTPLDGKRPILPQWQKTVLSDGDLRANFVNGRNLGLLLGSPSGGLVDIDLDHAAALIVAPHFLPPTPFVFGRATKPRSHWMYIVEPVPKTQQFQMPEGDMIVELRSTGAQTMVPPSKHPDGETVSLADAEAILPDPPTHIEAQELIRAVRRIAAASMLAANWPTVGSRQDAALALAGGLLRAGWNEDETCTFIRAVAGAARDDEFSLRVTTVRSTAQKLHDGLPVKAWPSLAEIVGGKIVSKTRDWLQIGNRDIAESQVGPWDDNSARYHCTDVGNAQRLAREHGEALKFVSAGRRAGGWMVWNGKCWSYDVQSAERLAKDTVVNIYDGARMGETPDERTRIAVWAHKSESAERVLAMLRMAQSESRIAAKIEEFDTDPFLLNVGNGILDLRTAALRPHDPAAKLTKMTRTCYDPNARCPTWSNFLDVIMDGDAELIAFVQRCVGYSLTGLSTEQVLFLGYGTGANGKSTFLETLRDVLGDYGQQAEFSTFLRHPHGKDGPRDDIANLRGARLVVAAEMSSGRQFDESVLKQLTGGDRVRARHLYSEEFEFSPQFKIWLAANHRPTLLPDRAIMRRILLIPFEKFIAPERRDPQLRAKFRPELPGILRWGVEGCNQWQANGLCVPERVRVAVDEYRAENDPISPFIEECCVIEQRASTTAGALYSAYVNWCTRNPQSSGSAGRGESQRWFGERLADRGLSKKKGRNGITWEGIGLSLTKESGIRELDV